MLLVFEINLVVITLLVFTGILSTAGETFPKNCTKTIVTEKNIRVTTLDYETYETCSWQWSWKPRHCYYKRRTKTAYKQVVVTENKQLPACCSYYTETATNSCIRACERGKYGENCQLNCSCPENAEHCCDGKSGNYTCYPGKTGINCTEDCNGGFFGPECQYKCFCMNNSTCNPADGSCNCSAGFIGKNCESECQHGRYGVNCSSVCNCLNTEMCNPITGDCQCKAGRKGENCTEECSNYMFGSNCTYACSCVKENTQTCNGENGTCVCNAGWEGTKCQYTCRNGFYGDKCQSVCNCSNGLLCEPLSGLCFPSCICKQLGTSNCDEQRKHCTCSEEIKKTSCKSANISTVRQIRQFMTSLCNCQDDDVFCPPTNETCYCKDGWTGDQCETPSVNSIAAQKRSFDSAAVIGGGVSAVGVILTVVIVFGVIITKRKQSSKAAQPQKHNGNPNHFTNEAYSTESHSLCPKENIANTSMETEYSIARRLSSTAEDTSGSQYVETADYHHIEFNSGKDNKEVTAVYSHLAGNASSKGNDGSIYDVSSCGRSDLACNVDNAYGVLRTTSEADDTYDSTANKSRTFGMEDNVYDSK